MGRCWLGRERFRASVLVVASLTASALVAGSASALPDGRNYEIVSPLDTAVNVGSGAPLPLPIFARADGGRLLYPNVLPLEGSPSGGVVSYVAERTGDGWSSQPIQRDPLPLDAVDGTNGSFATFPDLEQVLGGNGDLSRFATWSTTPLDPMAQRPGPFYMTSDLYLRRLGEPGATWISQPLTLPATTDNLLTFQSMNETGAGAHVVFLSPEAEDPAYPGVTGGLYMWSAGDAHPHLVGIDENGAPLGAPALGDGGVAVNIANMWRAISPDGRRVVFTQGSDIYVRVENQTLRVASVVATAAPHYEGASADTSRIYFSQLEAIPGTGAPPEGGVYAYDVPANGDAAAGNLEFVTSLGANGTVVAIADSGRHIYYLDNSGPAPRLMDYDAVADVRRFVAAVSFGDGFTTSQPWRRQIRVSPDGETVGFVSSAPGIGADAYDNGGYPQLFVYRSAPGARPVCVSCRPAGQTSGAESRLTYFGTRFNTAFVPFHTRNVTDSGRVFFVSADDLVPEDVNGKIDVYEWVDGALHLLSLGKGDGDSYFVDASETGDDVFISSFDALDPRHANGLEAIYDVRVGAPPPPSAQAPVPCAGDACQGPRGEAVTTLAPGSTKSGSPNAAPDANRPTAERAQLRVKRLTPSRLRAAARTGRLALSVTTNRSGTLVATATRRVRKLDVRVAHARRATADDRKTTTLRLTLSLAARRALRVHGHLTLRVVVRHSAVPRSASATVTLRRPALEPNKEKRS